MEKPKPLFRQLFRRQPVLLLLQPLDLQSFFLELFRRQPVPFLKLFSLCLQSFLFLARAMLSGDFSSLLTPVTVNGQNFQALTSGELTQLQTQWLSASAGAPLLK